MVTIDTYHYGIRFLERATHTLVIGLLKSLALSGVLLAIFYFVLTRPMLNVINALSQVNASSRKKFACRFRKTTGKTRSAPWWALSMNTWKTWTTAFRNCERLKLP